MFNRKNKDSKNVQLNDKDKKKRFIKRSLWLFVFVLVACIVFVLFVGNKSFFNPLTFEQTNILYHESSDYRKPLEMIYMSYEKNDYIRFRQNKELMYIYMTLDSCEFKENISDFEPDKINADYEPLGTITIVSAAEKNNDKLVTYIEWYGPDCPYINIDAKIRLSSQSVKRVFVKIPDDLRQVINDRFAQIGTESEETGE